MPLTLPNLDDRTFRDLVDEGVAMIPGIAPEWTNFNASDPGITLVELFAWITEALNYRLNQITEDDLRTYLRLLCGPGGEAEPGAEIEVELRQAIAGIEATHRAVTPDDFERLALAAHPGVVRARAVADRDLWARRGGRRERPGHISVVVVHQSDPESQEGSDTLTGVRDYLEERRLVATRLHVGPPRYIKVGVRLTLEIFRHASVEAVRRRATDRLRNFFDPLKGGPNKQGWPFGRAVYVSEIYELLDDLEEVDYVTQTIDPATKRPLDVLFATDGLPERLRRSAGGELVALVLEGDELIEPAIDPAAISIQRG